jgi:diguanylate cyclase (GGDEF)-like protein
LSLLSNSSVLIIDDVPTNIQVLAEALRQDYRVKVATNGPDALVIARQTLPDLILLDIMMPGMDGFEVCRQLKSDLATQAIPVIFVTASDDLGDEEKGLNLGAVDYITKPFHLPVVRARVRNHLHLKLKADLLERMAHIDSLTGIANRRRFDETLEVEMRRCQRSGQPISLLLLDIDHFKHYNDHFGHGMGDLCLTQVAASLQTNAARAADLVARYGGEEFAVILPHTDTEGAQQIAERLRTAILELNIPHAPDTGQAQVSISIGVTTALSTDQLSASGLVAAADKMLYQAKAGGRNRTSA